MPVTAPAPAPKAPPVPPPDPEQEAYEAWLVREYEMYGRYQ